MIYENKSFNTWEDVIMCFFENKVENIQNTDPKIPCQIFKAREYIETKDKEIKTEKDKDKLVRLNKAKEKKQKELVLLRDKAPSTEIRKWIDKASQTKISEGKRIIKATHVLKFSHSSSVSDGFLLNDTSDDMTLTTATIKNKTFDLAHNNGALITISRFLALSFSDNLIIDLILNDNYSFLTPFSENQEQLNQWCSGFGKLVEKRDLKTADKAKQIYFPLINENENIDIKEVEYHLITPLFSSSLAENIFAFVSNLKYGDEQGVAKTRRINNNEKSAMYYDKPYIDIANIGVQKFGGAQPQNVSMLNKNRSGSGYLFLAQPPNWQTQINPPVSTRSLFYAMTLDKRTQTTLDYLRDFLMRYQFIDLSIKDPERRKWIDKWLNEIIDEVLAYAAEIQNLEAGWTEVENIKLKMAHQYFLDPYRDDKTFQSARKASNWQAVVCQDFAHWLNQKLIGKEKNFTPQPFHTRIWIELLEQPLREHNTMIEANMIIREKV
jgi:CRISPR-associated protein Csy1